MCVYSHLIQFVPEDLSFHLVQVGLRHSILEKWSYDTTSHSSVWLTVLSVLMQKIKQEGLTKGMVTSFLRNF